jgi:hypothetical protein
VIFSIMTPCELVGNNTSEFWMEVYVRVYKLVDYSTNFNFLDNSRFILSIGVLQLRYGRVSHHVLYLQSLDGNHRFGFVFYC